LTDFVFWVAVAGAVIGGLAVDLWFHRRPRVIPMREAAAWTAGWFALGIAFAGIAWLARGGEGALTYITGYLIEWSLSVDNILVFVMILAGLGVAEERRHRLLLIGALGAILLRLGMIVGGSALLHQFEWLLYPFGAILLVAAARFMFGRDAAHAPDGKPAAGRTTDLLRRVLPARTQAAMLPIALIIGADVVFAVDSIPAIFGITRDPLIAFSSNALAVLGLRSLYFLIQGAMHRFRLLRPALALLLLFVGVKILAAAWIDVPTPLSLGVIVVVMVAAVTLSLAIPARPTTPKETST
jgi:tellurite resistance protein TerC